MENKKILIIEDEKPLRSALHDKLSREGFSVILEAQNGKDGLEIALREHPDMILLDIVMPVMDGMTMLRELRKDAWGKDVKVIILTNLSDNEKVGEAVSGGAYDYLVKTDWRLEDVISKIRERLGK